MRHFFFAPFFVALCAVPCFAQTNTTQRPPAVPNGGLNATLAQAERNQDADALLLGYGQAVTDASLARMAIGQLLTNFYSLRNQAQTPEQATQAVSEASLRFQVLQVAQNQVLIQQNQQILQQNAQMIALLQRVPVQVQPNR